MIPSILCYAAASRGVTWI